MMMREMKHLPDSQVNPETNRQISFTVLDYNTENPISGAKVRDNEGTFEKTTGSQGGCKITVPNGSYPVILVTKEGYEYSEVPLTDENEYIVKLYPSS